MIEVNVFVFPLSRHPRPKHHADDQWRQVKRHQDWSGANYSRRRGTCGNTTSSWPDMKNAKRKHGGLVGGEDRFYSCGRGYDFAGLVRVAGDQGRWPHVLAMGEADRYGYAGGEGMWEAAAAMRAAGGRAYVPLLGSLPREWGPYAPVIFVDAPSVIIRRWHDHRQPDFAARYRNLLVATLPGHPESEVFRVVATHGDLFGGTTRLADAQALRRFADPSVPCLIAGDWNSVPSGPGWEDRELNDPRFWPEEAHWARAPRVLWQHGPAQAGPYSPDTRALDYLLGWWDRDQGCRAGGSGSSTWPRWRATTPLPRYQRGMGGSGVRSTG
jgi:hypothetical protein